MRYLFMFRSLTYAQRASRLLERSGITGTVTRMPRSAGTKGCAYGVLVSPGNRDRARSVLTGGGLSPERIYLRRQDGSLKEERDDMA